MSVKVSEKYQVVIPEEVRKSLGFKPGTLVDVIAKDGIAYLVPVKPLRQLRDKLAGKLNAAHLRDKKDRSV